jgi:hypothetical protein
MEHRGPIEDATWPAQLELHVLDPGPPLRLQGYDVLDDLLPHVPWSEQLLLAFAGELPTPQHAAWLELALRLLAYDEPASAPTHVGLLAHMLVAPPASVVAVAAGALAQQAAAMVEAHGAWLRHCDDPTRHPAPSWPTHDEAWLQRLRAALGDELALLPALREGSPPPQACALALLHGCGLREPLRVITVIVQARLAIVMAEVERHVPRRLGHYPIEAPPVHYREDGEP